MTKDEELKDAREWLEKHIKERGGYLCDSSALLAYHQHRLETAWVRCADGLPEKSGTYNINVSGFGLCNGVHTLYFNEPNKLWVNINGGDKRTKSILHDHIVDWQPLPEPPEGVK